MNSGPLSTRIVLGDPRLAVMRDMVSTTRSQLMPGSTSMDKASQVLASTTVKARSFRPSNRMSPDQQSSASASATGLVVVQS